MIRRCTVVWLATAAACTLRAPHVEISGRPCSADVQCNGDICYAGSCRTRANQLSSIYAEVRAADPRLGVLQVASIDPRQSPVVEFQLVESLDVSGHVVQSPDPVTGAGFAPVPNASVVFRDADAGIPGRAQSLATPTDLFGSFSATIPASSWNVGVRTPSSPPSLDAGVVSTNMGDLLLVLPAKSSLSTLSASVVTGDAGVGGVLVSAAAPQGDSLGPGVTTASDGTFQLPLPPGTQTYLLQMGPSDGGPPIPTFNPIIIAPGDTRTVFDIGPLPARALLSGRVVDATGAAVTSARVQARSVSATGWTVSAATDTDPSGVFQLTLFEGTYLVEAVPDLDPAQPAVSGEMSADVDAGIAGTDIGAITCPPKAHARGSVVQPDGRPGGPGYQIVASRFPDRVVTSRPGTASATDRNGTFDLSGDPGQYHLTVLPTPEAALPLTYAVLTLGGTDAGTLAPIAVSPPVEVVGKVFGIAGAPVASATVEFFALDSTRQRAVLIGSTLTDANGAYRVVLPDVANPAGP